MSAEAIKDLLDQLRNATPEMAVIAMLIALGYGLKFIPKLSSKFIPPILLLSSMIVYPMIADNGKAPYTMRYPVVRQVMTGVVLWFVAWGIHGLVIKKLMEKLKAKGLSVPSGDTTTITKP